MEAIFALIIEYVSIWAPSLVAILGSVYTVLFAIGKFKELSNKWKNDETIKEMNIKFQKMASQNEELVHTNKLLLDQITKIKDYADHMKEEG